MEDNEENNPIPIKSYKLNRAQNSFFMPLFFQKIVDTTPGLPREPRISYPLRSYAQSFKMKNELFYYNYDQKITESMSNVFEDDPE